MLASRQQLLGCQQFPCLLELPATFSIASNFPSCQQRASGLPATFSIASNFSSCQQRWPPSCQQPFPLPATSRVASSVGLGLPATFSIASNFPSCQQRCLGLPATFSIASNFLSCQHLPELPAPSRVASNPVSGIKSRSRPRFLAKDGHLDRFHFWRYQLRDILVPHKTLCRLCA